MSVLLNRRSIRKYTEEKISDDTIEALLKAAMAAPSAGNQQPWEFIVLRDQETKAKITEVHPYSQMLLHADAAIVVCGDESREVFKGYWVQDCSAATENILIAAEEMGLGAVWLGVYPIEERVAAIKALLNLPENVTPLSIVPVGYKGEHKEPANRFNPERVHIDKW